jgi:hypothetical protein
VDAPIIGNSGNAVFSCSALDLGYLFHPGAHLGEGFPDSLSLFVSFCSKSFCLRKPPNSSHLRPANGSGRSDCAPRIDNVSSIQASFALAPGLF